MDYSRTGGATMRMPPSNFSQNGLASIFGIDLDTDTKSCAITSRKRTAIIAATVCGGVGLVALIVSGGCMAWRSRKKHTQLDEPVYEKDVHPDVPVDGRDVDEGAVGLVEVQFTSIGKNQG